MSSEGEILQAILALKGDVGEIKGKLDTIHGSMPELYTRVGGLEISHAKQKTAMRTWGIVAGSVAGFVTHLVSKKYGQ